MENKGVTSDDKEKHRWGGQGWNPAVDQRRRRRRRTCLHPDTNSGYDVTPSMGCGARQAAGIGEANSILGKPKLKSHIAFIKANFGKLPAYITKLETRDISLNSAVQVMKKVETLLKEIPRSGGETMRNKYLKIVKRNPGWKQVLLVT
ncbi:hypothetical protein ANN_27825 [Periplaneta americana]|uniref:Uncharacterized protein n=1 Tax=Periplaneta americana TaxID=6978 RepID=A0ABQ8RVD8_PERAM|nr:hypothetical protein ANN_27825 [Periplaneta americana]